MLFLVGGQRRTAHTVLEKYGYVLHAAKRAHVGGSYKGCKRVQQAKKETNKTKSTSTMGFLLLYNFKNLCSRGFTEF